MKSRSSWALLDASSLIYVTCVHIMVVGTLDSLNHINHYLLRMFLDPFVPTLHLSLVCYCTGLQNSP